MTATDEARSGQRRRERSTMLLWVLGALVAVAVVVGAVVGGLRGPAALDRDSPEGAVQGYLDAVLDRDYAEAVAYLSEQTAERCPASAFRETWVPDDLAAHLEGVQVEGDRAEVRVRLRAAADPPPFDAGFESTEAFTLVEEDGVWRLTGEPWPLYSCREKT